MSNRPPLMRKVASLAARVSHNCQVTEVDHGTGKTASSADIGHESGELGSPSPKRPPDSKGSRLDPLIFWAQGERRRTNVQVARMGRVSVSTVKRRRRELRASGELPPLLSNATLADIAGVSESTMYRAKRQMRAEARREAEAGS